MTENIIRVSDDIGDLISLDNWKIFGIGGLPSTRSELYSFIPGFELICSNASGELESVREKCKVSVFDLEKMPKSKKPEDILADRKVMEYVEKTGAGKNIAIYIMKPSEAVENICVLKNWKLIANKADLFKEVDGRIFFNSILEKIGVEKKVKTLTLGELRVQKENVFDEFEDKIVVQSLLGAGGGSGTFFARKDKIGVTIDEISKKLEILGGDEDSLLVITEFIDGYDLGIMVCVTRDNGILVSSPRFQLISVKEAVEGKDNKEGVFCGHNWSLSNQLDQNVVSETRELAKKIGLELKRTGFLGIFGVDFMLDKATNKVTPIEVNPRLLGSFPVEIEIQQAVGEVPLVAFHLLELLGVDYKIEKEDIFYKKTNIREGSHLYIFNPWKKDVVFKEALKGGVYCIEGVELKFLRKGFSVSDIHDLEKEFILTSGVPVIGRRCKKNKQLLRIVWRRSIQVGAGKEIDDKARNIVNIVKKELKKISVFDEK
jgi:hypothetical protein